jgi:hypothetical protein
LIPDALHTSMIDMDRLPLRPEVLTVQQRRAGPAMRLHDGKP